MSRAYALLSLILLTLVCVPALAAPVSQATALAAARRWLTANPAPGVQNAGARVWTVTGEVVPLAASGTTVGYVAELAPSGFVIIAGDDAIAPVVYFSTGGSAGAAVADSVFLAIIRAGIVEAVQGAASYTPTQRAGIRAQWADSRTLIDASMVSIVKAPVLSTQWDRNMEWVDPATGEPGMSFSDCWYRGEDDWRERRRLHVSHGRMAMAQVRHFFRIDQGTPYVWPDGYVEYYGHNYEGMPDVVNAASPRAGVEALAELLSRTQNIDLNWGTDWQRSTTFHDEEIRRALISYSLAAQAHSCTFPNQTRLEWVRDDLHAGYPVIVNFETPGGREELAVADGIGRYGDQAVYHLNWGRGGPRDGWYTMPPNATAAGGFRFSSLHTFVWSIRAAPRQRRHRADVSAAPASGVGSPGDYVGENRYGQPDVLAIPVSPQASAGVSIKLQNESTDYAYMWVRADAGDANVSIRYFVVSHEDGAEVADYWTVGRDITAQVTASEGMAIPQLRPGKSAYMRAEITWNATATGAERRFGIYLDPGVGSARLVVPPDTVTIRAYRPASRPNVFVRTVGGQYTDLPQGATVPVNAAARFEVLIRNDGEITDTFRCRGTLNVGGSMSDSLGSAFLGVQRPAGWSWVVTDETGRDITADLRNERWNTGSLAPGASRTLGVRVTPGPGVPSEGEAGVAIVARPSTGASTDMDLARMVVGKIRYGVGLEGRLQGQGLFGPSLPEALASAARPAVYEVRLRNTGLAPDSYLVTLPMPPTGWTTRWQYTRGGVTTQATGGSLTTPELQPDEALVLVCTATPGDGVVAGVPAEMEVRAASRNAGYTSETLVLMPVKGALGVKVMQARTTDEPFRRSAWVQYAYVGTPATYVVRVTNTGTVNETFSVRAGVSAAPGWTVHYYTGASATAANLVDAQVAGNTLQTPPLAPDASVDYCVTVEPNASVAVAANCSITWTVQSLRDAAIVDFISLNTQKGACGAIVGAAASESATPAAAASVITTPGRAVPCYFTVGNAGGGVDAFVLHHAFSAPDWTITWYDPASNPITSTGIYTTEALSPGVSRRFTAVVTPPASAAMGSTATLTLAALSTRAPSEAAQATVTLRLQTALPSVTVRQDASHGFGPTAERRVSGATSAYYEFLVENLGGAEDSLRLMPAASITGSTTADWAVVWRDGETGAPLNLSGGLVIGPVPAHGARLVTATVTPAATAGGAARYALTLVAASQADPSWAAEATATTTKGTSTCVVEFLDGSTWVDTPPNRGALGGAVPLVIYWRVRNTGDGAADFRVTAACAGEHAGQWVAQFSNPENTVSIPVWSVPDGWLTGEVPIGGCRAFRTTVLPETGLAAGDAFDLTVTAGATGGPTDSATVHITKAAGGVDVTIKRRDADEAFAAEAAGSDYGAPVHYLVKVRNTGTAPDVFRIRRIAEVLGGSWGSTVWSAEGEAYDVSDWADDGSWAIGPLSPGEERVFRVQVVGMLDNAPGQQCAVSLRATSDGDPTVSDTARTTTTQRAITDVVLTLDPTGPQASAVPVALSASVPGAATGDAVEYAYYVRQMISAGTYGEWQTIRDFALPAPLAWVPTGAGRYQLRADARPLGVTDRSTPSPTVAYVVGSTLTGVRLNATPALTVPVSVPVSFTAVPTGGIALEYRFLFRTLSATAYTLVRNWDPNPAYPEWTPGVGSYVMLVQVREMGGTRVFEARQYVNVRPDISAMALVGSPASPTAVGQKVVLTAGITGGAAPRYRFEAMPVGASAPTFVRDYTTSRTTWWTPSAPGAYTVKVMALDAGKAEPQVATITYVVNPAVSALSLTMTSPTSPTAVGVPIRLLATPTDGGTLEYQFLWNFSETTRLASTWTKLAYGNGRGYNHVPDRPGYYTFRVYAREKGSTANFQKASADLKVQVNAPITDYGITATPNGSGQYTLGVNNVVGTGGTPLWKFWVRKVGTSGYTLLQDYSATTTASKWTPQSGATYSLMVYMQEAGSSKTNYDVSRSVYFTAP